MIIWLGEVLEIHQGESCRRPYASRSAGQNVTRGSDVIGDLSLKLYPPVQYNVLSTALGFREKHLGS